MPGTFSQVLVPRVVATASPDEIAPPYEPKKLSALGPAIRYPTPNFVATKESPKDPIRRTAAKR